MKIALPTNNISRRDFVAAASTVAISSATGWSTPGAKASPAPRSAMLLNLSATDAVAALKRGEISAESYAGALLAQCEAGKALNAFISLEPAKVLEAARAADRRRLAGGTLGLLHGLPIPIKDSINTKDYRTTGGTPALRNFRPHDDAPMVRALIEAGGIVLGKTNLHELSFGWTSNNLAFGAVRNPYDPTRIPGGSSGGTAAAIAARMSPLGVAEDTEGSIRVPAALCGVAGFRPTTGRYSTVGAIPITTLFDQVGPIARAVADLILFDRVVAGEHDPISPTALEGVKLGVARDYWFSNLDPEVERITAASLVKLRDAGAELVEAQIPDLARLVELIEDPIQYHDARYTLQKYLEDYGAGVTLEQLVAMASVDVKKAFQRYVMPGGAGFITDGAYAAARDIHLPALRAAYRNYFVNTGVAAIVFPTTMIPAPPIGQDAEVEIRGKKVPFDIAIARNIGPGSAAGLPCLVHPAGLTRNGLPVALEFDAPAGKDRALLALGLSLEHVLGIIAAPTSRTWAEAAGKNA